MEKIITRTKNPLHSLRYILFRLRTAHANESKITDDIAIGGTTITTKEIVTIASSIEDDEKFDGWYNFSITWDVLWVGFDKREWGWVIGRHNAEARKLIIPITLIRKIDNNFIVNTKEIALISKLHVPRNPKVKLTEKDEIEEQLGDFITQNKSQKMTDKAEKEIIEIQKVVKDTKKEITKPTSIKKNKE